MSILDKKWNRESFDYTSWKEDEFGISLKPRDMYWYVTNYGEWIDLNLDEDDLLERTKAHMHTIHEFDDDWDARLVDVLYNDGCKREYGERGNFMLHHPTVISIVYPSTRWHIHETNLKFWNKVFYLRKAYLKKDVDAYLMLIERPYRIPEFIAWCLDERNKMSKKKYWEVIRWLWTDTENVYEHFNEWLALLLDFDTKEVKKMMSKEDKKTFDSLPDDFMVYRGGEHEHMSWTLSKEKAEWFRDRYKGLRDCKLFEKRIKKDEVLAYINARNEEEIILRPSLDCFFDYLNDKVYSEA